MLDIVRRTFTSHSIRARKLLYLSIVRSKLIYYSQVWQPHLIKDISGLERVERQAMKFIPSDFKSY